MKRFTILALVLFALMGCNDSGPRIVKVSGTVVRGGKAVPNVAITLTPLEGGRPSWGLADAEGQFKMQYTVNQDGAQVGKHKVSIEFPPSSPQEENDLATGKKKRPPEHKLMKDKYGDASKSPLIVEVKDNGEALTIALD